MKRFLLLGLLVSLASAAEAMQNLTVTAGASCPGNVLQLNATGSDGQPASGVEFRVVLYEPYQGLVALTHTGADGSASTTLRRSGSYRIYIYAQQYEHDDYVEFGFTACPPPPPKPLDLSITFDCNASTALVSVLSEGAPLEGVLVRTQNWSSLTTASGNVSFPFSGGDLIVTAEKAGYAKGVLYDGVDCTPPECRTHEDCADDDYCVGGTCMKVTGACGYPQGHVWVHYACCSDSDCKNMSLRCVNRTCVAYQPPPAQPNVTKNESTPPAPERPAGCAGAAMLLLAALSLFFRGSR